MVPDDEEDFLIMNFALQCENGLDLHYDEACALAAESLQLEYEAYMLRGHGNGEGHPEESSTLQYVWQCVFSGAQGLPNGTYRIPPMRCRGTLEWRCSLPQGSEERIFKQAFQHQFGFYQNKCTGAECQVKWQKCEATCGLLLKPWL